MQKWSMYCSVLVVLNKLISTHFCAKHLYAHVIRPAIYTLKELILHNIYAITMYPLTLCGRWWYIGGL